MQERCPKCGDGRATPAYTRAHSIWRACANAWMVVWLSIAAAIAVEAFAIGRYRGWHVGGWVGALAVAAIVIALIPRWIVRYRQDRRRQYRV